MKKIIIISFISILMISGVRAQSEPSIKFSAGAGTFNMGELRDFRDYLQKRLPFETSIVSDFPIWTNYKIMLIGLKKDYTLGVGLDYASTGSRLSYADYSGSYSMDMVLNAYSIYLYNCGHIKEKEKWSIDYHVELGLCYTLFDLKEQLLLGDHNANESLSCESFGLHIEPDVEFNYKVYRNITIGPYFGYNLNVSSALKNNGHELQYASKKEVKANWSGFRSGLRINVPLGSLFE